MNELNEALVEQVEKPLKWREVHLRACLWALGNAMQGQSSANVVQVLQQMQHLNLGRDDEMPLVTAGSTLHRNLNWPTGHQRDYNKVQSSVLRLELQRRDALRQDEQDELGHRDLDDVLGQGRQ